MRPPALFFAAATLATSALAAPATFLAPRAASLSDLCTVANVEAIAPVDGVLGASVVNGSLTAAVVTNYTVSDASAATGGMPAGTSTSTAAATTNSSSSSSSSNTTATTTTYNFCNVTLSLTHAGHNDSVFVEIWLPEPSSWQSRWLSTGGGGFSATSGESGLGAGLQKGASTGLTDGGLSKSGQASDWALLSPGNVDFHALTSLGYRALHELTVVGKALTAGFYSSTSFKSYYSGCSQGGRMGLAIVQKYPEDFDGVAVGAPAIYFARFITAKAYPVVKQRQLDYYPSQCEMDVITSDAVAACDALDGREDGVVSRSDLCSYDARASIGKSFSCNETAGGSRPMMGGMMMPPSSSSSDNATSSATNVTFTGTVSEQAAEVANAVWGEGLVDSSGKRLWHGFSVGTPTSSILSTTLNATTRSYELETYPFDVGFWLPLFVDAQPESSLDITASWDVDVLRNYTRRGLLEYYSAIHASWTDLSGFASRGGKLLGYHGEADDSIYPRDSVKYYEAVREAMYGGVGNGSDSSSSSSSSSSYASMQQFYRLFLVPGAGHCRASKEQPAPYPQDPLAQVIEWVETGAAPDRLNATSTQGSGAAEDEARLCMWPTRPAWRSSGEGAGNATGAGDEASSSNATTYTMECVEDANATSSYVPVSDSVPVPI